MRKAVEGPEARAAPARRIRHHHLESPGGRDIGRLQRQRAQHGPNGQQQQPCHTRERCRSRKPVPPAPCPMCAAWDDCCCRPATDRPHRGGRCRLAHRGKCGYADAEIEEHGHKRPQDRVRRRGRAHGGQKSDPGGGRRQSSPRPAEPEEGRHRACTDSRRRSRGGYCHSRAVTVSERQPKHACRKGHRHNGGEGRGRSCRGASDALAEALLEHDGGKLRVGPSGDEAGRGSLSHRQDAQRDQQGSSPRDHPPGSQGAPLNLGA
jgi:hypothetical protein